MAQPDQLKRNDIPFTDTAVATVQDELALLENLKLNLQAAREKLMLVQPDTLSDEDHAKWGEEIFKISIAINAVRKALLGRLSAAFTAELPAIEAATGRLKGDLARLQESVQVIGAVASVLGIIERIVTLVG
jgi:hypothetical protein